AAEEAVAHAAATERAASAARLHAEADAEARAVAEARARADEDAAAQAKARAEAEARSAAEQAARAEAEAAAVAAAEARWRAGPRRSSRTPPSRKARPTGALPMKRPRRLRRWNRRSPKPDGVRRPRCRRERRRKRAPARSAH